MKKRDEETRWEFYLHKTPLSDMTFEEFNRRLGIGKVEPTDKKKVVGAIQDTFTVFNNMKLEEGAL